MRSVFSLFSVALHDAPVTRSDHVSCLHSRVAVSTPNHLHSKQPPPLDGKGIDESVEEPDYRHIDPKQIKGLD